MDNRRALIAAAIAVAASACSPAPPPALGEVVIEIDADLTVLELVSRVRVDFFSEHGQWYRSLDVGRPDRRDWPFSFSLYSRDETRATRALVRVRAYPEGALRESPECGAPSSPELCLRQIQDPPFAEPKSAGSLDALCAEAGLLTLGKPLTLRRGAARILSTTDSSCPVESGSAAARLRIAVPGRYRVGIVGVEPRRATGTPPTIHRALFVRTECGDARSELACAADPLANAPPIAVLDGTSEVESSERALTLDLDLVVGEYFVLTGGADANQPADLTLLAALTDAFPAQPISAERDAAPGTPLRYQALRASDPRMAMPGVEPEPSATVDRLLALSLEPGEQQTRRVLLNARCAGTEAILPVTDALNGVASSRVQWSGARTCTDQEKTLEDVRVEGPRAGATKGVRPVALGTDAAGCDALAEDAGVRCIPGGVFLLGSQAFRGFEQTASTPRRPTVVTRFWLDRHEVTVARFRKALAAGFNSPDPSSPQSGADVFPPPIAPFIDDRFCSYSASPLAPPFDREGYGLSCVSWSTARAFCHFVGGDLPTEVQWEYAASSAGRPWKGRYPWTEVDGEPPRCTDAIFGRAHVFLAGATACFEQGFAFGPQAVDAALRDRSPAGVVGLAGGLTEWVLDSGQSYGGACWRASSLRDRRCWEEQAPLRAARGGAWSSPLVTLNTAFRSHYTPQSRFPTLGFRCAYAEAPR